MLAAGWSACFIGAMGIAAKQLKVALPADTYVDAEVDLGMNGDGSVRSSCWSVSKDRVTTKRPTRSAYLSVRS
jgi:organic hydroperoxide reductase OsmC/OhrA